jgi:hypothetical protein
MIYLASDVTETLGPKDSMIRGESWLPEGSVQVCFREE